MEREADILSLLLCGIVLAVAAGDTAWAIFGHFDVDGRAYAGTAGLAVFLSAGAVYYRRLRQEPALSAMLAGTAFLCAFSAAAALLNNMLLTVAGARIDLFLARIDQALGVSWLGLMALAANHPHVDAVLRVVYISMLPQVALTVVVLGCTGRATRIYTFCLAVAAGAAIAVGIWTVAPSIGAVAVYALPARVAATVHAPVDAAYAHQIAAMFAHGPGFITPDQVKGLIGFPSYHAVLALLVMWALRDVPKLNWAIFALNALVLFSTPIEGGHHVIDVVAGFAVAGLAIASANSAARWARARGLARERSCASPERSRAASPAG